MWTTRLILLAVLAVMTWYDVGVRFRQRYQEYRHAVRMFGPAWLWGVIVVAILLIGGRAWWQW